MLKNKLQLTTMLYFISAIFTYSLTLSWHQYTKETLQISLIATEVVLLLAIIVIGFNLFKLLSSSHLKIVLLGWLLLIGVSLVSGLVLKLHLSSNYSDMIVLLAAVIISGFITKQINTH